MNTKLIIANWKSHKTAASAREFLEEFEMLIQNISLEGKEILLCPSFSLLATCAEVIKNKNLPIKIGAQDISAFGKGAYTGEVNGEQIKEFAEYVIIGHSERKRYLNESEELLRQKIDQAKKNNLIPILCIQDENDFLEADIPYIAYEPPTAISTFGTGKAEEVENVEEVFATLSQKSSAKLLYGGSVDSSNIASYCVLESLYGFLVGGKSLEARSFSELLKNAV